MKVWALVSSSGKHTGIRDGVKREVVTKGDPLTINSTTALAIFPTQNLCTFYQDQLNFGDARDTEICEFDLVPVKD